MMELWPPVMVAVSSGACYRAITRLVVFGWLLATQLGLDAIPFPCMRYGRFRSIGVMAL